MSKAATVIEAETRLRELVAKGEWTPGDWHEATELLLPLLAADRELVRAGTVTFTHDELIVLSDVMGRHAVGVTETLSAFTGKPEVATALAKINAACASSRQPD